MNSLADEEKKILKIKHFSRRKIENYVKIKDLSGKGTHSKKIKLYVHRNNPSDCIVKKQYHKKHQNIFFNEVYWLLNLQKSNIVPRLIRVDPNILTFWMTYCGPSLTVEEFTLHRDQITNLEEILMKEYECYHNDVKPDNVCMRDQRLYLIDCGWMHKKKILPGYAKTSYGGTNPNCFSEIREESLARLTSKPDIDPYSKKL